MSFLFSNNDTNGLKKAITLLSGQLQENVLVNSQELGKPTTGIVSDGPEILVLKNVARVENWADDKEEEKINLSVSRKHRNAITNNMLSKLTYCVVGMFSPGVAPVTMAGSRSSKRKNKKKGQRGDKSLVKAEAVKDGTNWSILSGSVPATKIFRMINNKPYTIVQSVLFGTVLSPSATVPTFGAVGFTLNQIDQVSTLIALFDQYKIAFVEVWFTPQNTGSQGTEYSTVLDFDDSNNLASYAAANDYQNCVTTTLNDGQYRCLVPHVAVAAYSGAFTSFANETAPWIDCSSSAVVHYGIKLAAVVATAATTVISRARFHVRFRNVR